MIVAPARGASRILTREEIRAYLDQHVRVSDDGCMVWAGSTRKGYIPDVQWAGRRYSARRLIMELDGKPVSERQVVYTICGTHNCVNPEHLRIGSRLQMNRAKARHGLSSSGPRHALAIAAGKAARAKIPITERFAIARMRADGMTWAQIADRYGTHISAPHKQLKTWEAIFGPAAYWSLPDDLRDAA